MLTLKRFIIIFAMVRAALPLQAFAQQGFTLVRAGAPSIPRVIIAQRDKMVQLTVARSATANPRLEPDSCSGFLISPSGHILTALHCLDGLLEDRGARIVEDANGITLGHVNAYALGEMPSDPRRHLPEVRIQDATGASLGNAHLVSWSPGYVIHMAQILPSLGLNLNDLDRPTSTPPDYAILKVEGHATARAPRPFPYFDLSTNNAYTAASETTLYGLAFPAQTCRPPANPRPGSLNVCSHQGSTDGRHLYASAGSLLSSYFQTIWQNQFSIREAGLDLMDQILLGPHSLLSNLDAIPGSSGGAVLNAQGELMGMITIAASTQLQYWSDSTMILARPVLEAASRELQSLAP